MGRLYPELKLPEIVVAQAAEKKYKPAPHFDYSTGDFLFDGAGRPVIAEGKEAFEQWCLKVCQTERGTRLAYSDKIGTEFESAMKMPDVNAVRSAIIRTITESIMVNPCAQWVRDFTFELSGDELRVSFEVKGHSWESSRLAL